MSRAVLLVVVLGVLMPRHACALSAFHAEAISGRIGYPFCWEIGGMALRYFPTKDLAISRLGIDAYAGREGQYTYGGERYSVSELMPLRLLVMLAPSSISEVTTDAPFFVYFFIGTGISAYSHKIVDGGRAWGGGSSRFWNGGLAVSFLSTVEIEFGFVRSYVSEYLGVDAIGDVVDYSPGLIFNRLYCSCKVGINTALIRWD